MVAPRTGNGRHSARKRVNPGKYGQPDDVEIFEHEPRSNGADVAPDWPDLAKKTDRPLKTYCNARAAIIKLGIVCGHDVFHDRMLIGDERLSDELCSTLRQTIIDRFHFDPGKDCYSACNFGWVKIGCRLTAGGEVNQLCPSTKKALLHLLIQSNIGASKPVDRLLRIAHQEEFAGDWAGSAPVCLAGIVGRE